MNKKITMVRLSKEEEALKTDPIPQAAVVRESCFCFHFCLFHLEDDFAGGFYHGIIDLPEDYPFSPPKIRFLTENGRFEVNKHICTTFTHYHKETWSSSWSIKTILTALISFMYSNERGIGGLFYSSSKRKALAKKSLKNNLANPQFVHLFKEDLLTRGGVSSTQFAQLTSSDKANKHSGEKKEEEGGSAEEQEENEQRPVLALEELNKKAKFHYKAAGGKRRKGEVVNQEEENEEQLVPPTEDI